ncbi:efflux RND transporter periplasmic adaptor subunit [Pseudokordiimonas caeni]|uniref:efflux RND transporter periplasmic adaptor subunit n=1 Tax=Pseudokordiimonas caeni TaxID=2997908 RepID=UPI0028112738|nr:efflux RND transporter periplasmic adaptor subunit [Pseudokordiimonas caeni]
MDSRIKAHLKVCLVSSIFIFAGLQGAAAQFGGEMPPPAVGVVEVKAATVPVVSELPGRIAATRVAEVRPQVSGILKERVFEQGARVKAGDVLFRIDPAMFKVRVASAEASLERAKAADANAKLQLERQRVLLEKKVASQAAYDSAVAASAQAEADVAFAKAAVAEAKINLAYTEIRAPISGVIGGALVTEGALVTAEGAESLALIQQVDPVYADFTQSADELLALKRAVADGRLESTAEGDARVSLVLGDGTDYGRAGKLLFSTANVDPGTGQVTLRAEFPNDSRDLLPGMYVRVKIEQAVRQGAITVPQRAVFWTDTGAPQVYVVNAEGVAEVRPVTLGSASGSSWVVEDGLADGATVIVNGVQKVQPGGKVMAEPWSRPEGSTLAQRAE